MGLEGLDLPGAIERLAELTGIPAPRRRTADPQVQDATARLYAANTAASAWFARQLEQARGGEARAYLERRGVDRATARAFGLGYAPDDRQALKAGLAAEGFTEAELVEAGLLAVPEDGKRGAYDRFRHRIMFPIQDERGRVVGFGGRALGEARAKYLNTPDTPLFHKGELLYNHHRAVPAARERREIVLAEGYMDVIALARAGFPHAVAPLGTAVTERQLQLLWRHADAPLVCLDGDQAGLAAALRAAERALPVMPAGKALRFAILPEGEDPDSFVARHGAAAMAQVLAKAHGLSQLLWRLETQGRRFDTPEEQAGLRRRLRAFAKLAADPDLRTSLDANFHELLEAAFPRRARWRRGAPPAGPRARGHAQAWEGVGPSRLAAGLQRLPALDEGKLLAPALLNPELLDGNEELLAAIELKDPDLARLRDEILLWLGDGPTLDAGTLAQHLLRHGLASVRERVLASVAGSGQLRGETTAWPSAGEWGAMLARWQPLSAQERQKVSFAESVLSGGAAEVAANRTSLDRLLNSDINGETAVPEGDGTSRRGL
jgi:DNA primase